MPSRIDSLIPGIESRYSVSWIARQSSSGTSTALPRFPVIRTGSREAVTSSSSRYNRPRAPLTVTVSIILIVRQPVRHVNVTKVWSIAPAGYLNAVHSIYSHERLIDFEFGGFFQSPNPFCLLRVRSLPVAGAGASGDAG